MPWPRGKRRSEEHRRKLSETNKGRVSWIKGKHHSKETRCKISNSLKGNRNPMYGKHLSEETKRKISLSKMGKPGTKHTENWKREASARQRGANNSFYGRKHTDEELRKMSIAVSKIWKDPEYVKKQMFAKNIKPNKHELILNEFLQQNFPNEWKYVGDGQVIIRGKCPDFISCSGEKRVILYNGIFWHLHVRNKRLTREQVEKLERMPYEEHGFKVLHIWQDEMKDELLLRNKLGVFL